MSGIDWSPITNSIVTCGHDRNAYVWNLEGNTWKPTLCVIRIPRAATIVRWSPSGQKFAVASCSKQIAVCQYESESDWWVSRQIKKHKSTIVDVAWSPNSIYLATASTDGKCRIVDAYIRNLDTPAALTAFETPWSGNKPEFGQILAEFDTAGSWVNTVAWSPNGKTVAFTGHGSTLHFVEMGTTLSEVQSLAFRDLPFLASAFIDDDTFVAAGWDNNPAIFLRNSEGVFEFKTFADRPEKAEAKAADNAVKSNTSKAFAMFQSADTLGVKFGSQVPVAKSDYTTHKAVIVCLTKDPVNANGFATSSIDGRLTSWDVKEILT